MPTTTELVITNVDIVLDDDIIRGTLHWADGHIVAVDEGRSMLRSALDGEGDLLLPGLVEIHTDALEWHLRPRPQALWPSAAAVAGHDAMLAASGITTVLDSLCIGDLGGDGFRPQVLTDALTAITRAQMNGVTRIDHKLHYRCEVADPRTPELFDTLADNPLLRLVSLMDHTPGGRQYTDLEGYRGAIAAYGHTLIEVEDRIERLRERQARYALSNWQRIAAAAVERALPLASHDDATPDDVELAIRSGVRIAEFPTTEVAATAAGAAGLRVAAGAPNVVRGGSHSGNVAAEDLARKGLLHILTSDYVPYSLLHAPFELASRGVMRLSDAVALVTALPAESVGLNDRGRIEAGRRADIVRVRVDHGVPVVRSVFSAGRRVG